MIYRTYAEAELEKATNERELRTSWIVVPVVHKGERFWRPELVEVNTSLTAAVAGYWAELQHSSHATVNSSHNTLRFITASYGEEAVQTELQRFIETERVELSERTRREVEEFYRTLGE